MVGLLGLQHADTGRIGVVDVDVPCSAGGAHIAGVAADTLNAMDGSNTLPAAGTGWVTSRF